MPTSKILLSSLIVIGAIAICVFIAVLAWSIAEGTESKIVLYVMAGIVVASIAVAAVLCVILIACLVSYIWGCAG